MSNELATFTTPANLGGCAIRVIESDGKSWFVATDVCRALNLDMDGGTHRRLQALAEDERKIVLGLTGNLAQGPTGRGGLRAASRVTVIAESGMYKLILRANSSNPAAAAFQDWVTRDVLPAIRKDGAYIMGEEKVRTGEMSEDELLARAVLAAKSKLDRITAERDQLAKVSIKLTLLTMQEWEKLNHVYPESCDTSRIASNARALAKERGIIITKRSRDVPIGGGEVIKSEVYPRELLDEAAAALGFTFMQKSPD